MDEKSYQYGFQLGWQSCLSDTRRAYANMRTAIVDAFPSDVKAKTRRKILEALNEFQLKVDWEFDV
jgi:hypothetical protein